MRKNLANESQKTHPMKGKTMLNKKASALAAVACITTVGLALGISPAKAFDPVAQKFAIVGSDTLEDVVGALANGTSITGSGVKATTSDSSTFGSFDATGTGTIFTKAYGTRFQRPNGSGDGRTALDALINNAQYTSTFSGRDKTYDAKVTLAEGDIDIVRASSGGTVNSNGLDNMQRFSFGRDAIALAYGTGLTWTASGVVEGYIAQADIKAIYQCTTATLNKYGITKAWIPQAGSGTRNDFISKTGVSETQDILANLDAASNLAVNGSNVALGNGCIHVGQEHDASTLGATEIMPMSATRWIAMKNGASYDKSGTARLGGFVSTTASPVSGDAPNLVPGVTYYKDTTWGRDTYLFVDRRRTDSSTATAKPTALVSSGTSTSFVVDSTSGIYVGQAVAGTGIAAGTLVKKVYASGSKFGKGTNGSSTLLTSSAPGVDQYISGTGIAANTRVTAVSSFSTKALYFDASSGSDTLTLTVTDPVQSFSSDYAVGQSVVGAGIPKYTYVTAVDSGAKTVTLSANTTAPLSNTSVTIGDTTRGTAAAGSTSMTIEKANSHIVVGAAVSGTNVISGTLVTAISGTSVTLSKGAGNATTASAASTSSTSLVVASTTGATVGEAVTGSGIPSNTTVSAVDSATKTITLSAAATVAKDATVTFATAITTSTGGITFTKNSVTLNNALTADIAAGDGISFLKTIKLSVATTADLATSADLSFSSPSYDPILARALDYSYSGSLTYQGGALFGTLARPAQPTTATAASGATVLTLPTTNSVKMSTRVVVGETVSGTGITSGTTVTAVDTTANTVTISAATTAALSATDVLFGYSYSQMSDVIYPSFSPGSIAAVKLKFGFLPASSQPTNEYAGK